MKAHRTLDHPPIFPIFSPSFDLCHAHPRMTRMHSAAASCGLNVANCRVHTWPRLTEGKSPHWDKNSMVSNDS